MRTDSSRYETVQLNWRRRWRFRAHFRRCWRYWSRSGDSRLRARFFFRIAQLLDLVEPLQFFVRSHGEELDHRLGHAQPAFNFVHCGTSRFNHHQYEDSVVELPDPVREPP